MQCVIFMARYDVIQLKGLVENYAKCVFSKVPEFLLVAFKLLEIHWAAFFRCFTLRFQEKTYANTQEVWLVYNASLLSLLRQTKGFFCFSFNKRSQKHAAAKTWVFAYVFLENEA